MNVSVNEPDRQPTPRALKKKLKELHQYGVTLLDQMSRQYRLEDEDKSHWSNKLTAVLTTGSYEEGREIVRKTLQGYEVHCHLNKPEERNADWYMKNAAKARSLAKSLAASGDSKSATAQTKRAIEYENKAQELLEKSRG